MARFPFAAAALALALAACGGEGDLVVANHASSTAGSGGNDGLAGSSPGGHAGQSGGSGGSAGQGGSAGSAGSGGQSGSAGSAGSAGAVTPVRTVVQRNPFGNYADSKNLLWDGDFEWAGPFIEQYSWTGAKGWSTSGPPEIITSPDCHSGFKCARLAKSGAAASIGVSPTTATSRVGAWAHVEPGNVCSKVTIYLSACFVNASAGAALKPVSDTPDAQGWCRFDEERPTQESTPCVFVTNKTKGVVLLDDVSLGFGSDAAAPPASSAKPDDPDDKALLDVIRDDLRRRRKGGDLPRRIAPPSKIPLVRQAPRR